MSEGGGGSEKCLPRETDSPFRFTNNESVSHGRHFYGLRVLGVDLLDERLDSLTRGLLVGRCPPVDLNGNGSPVLPRYLGKL